MTVEKLELSLQDGDAEVRRRAVLSASNISGEGFRGLLLRALGDSDWRVRKEAAQVAIRRALDLGILGDLVQGICQGENVGLRNAALDVLEALGHVAAPALIAALPQAPEHARKFLVEALGESGGDEVVEQLALAAASDDTNVAGEAIEALARIGGPLAERVIRSRLNAKDAFLRLAALDSLNRRDAFVSWEELEPLLQDRLLRRVAISALGRTGRVEALAPLLAALEESAVHVVGAAAAALVRLMNDTPVVAEAAEASLLALDDRARAWLRAVLTSATEPEPRRAAAELLARSKDVEALSGLVTYLANEAPSAQTILALRAWADTGVEPLLALLPRLESAQERAIALELAADLALVSADGAHGHLGRVRAALRRGLSDTEPAVVVAAARCLAQWADEHDAGSLVQLTLSPDHGVARASARALEALAQRAPEAVERALSGFSFDGPHGAALVPVIATLGGIHALDRLQALMSVDDSEVRRAALHGLGRLGGERAAGLVALALADEDTEVQSMAAQVLGRIRDESGGAPGLSGLVNAVTSEFAHVRAAVARALGQINSERAVEPLRELLRDADSGVAMAAVDALGQLSPGELAQGLSHALAHHDHEVVKAALRALSRCHDLAAPDELIHALKHPAWDVRQLSAELISELNVERAAAPLRTALAGETDDLAREALRHALNTLVGEG